LARITVSYKSGVQNTVPITGNDDAYEMILSVWDKELLNIQEQVMAFFLNRRNQLIGYRLICSGNTYQCFVDNKLLASIALHTMACTVILAHNHPSGNLTPSDQDEVITQKTKAALELIEVKLLDKYPAQ
jgi:DNA repair protein RadC